MDETKKEINEQMAGEAEKVKAVGMKAKVLQPIRRRNAEHQACGQLPVCRRAYPQAVLRESAPSSLDSRGIP
jgi:hypothetical protein